MPTATAASELSPLPDVADEAFQIFVDGVGREISQTWGRVSNLAGRIFAALYLAGRPMDMDELSSLLGRSKSNVLVNLRSLVELGLASKARVPQSRRDQYEVAGDYGNVILRAFFRRLGDDLASNSRSVRQAVELLDRAEPAAGDVDRVEAMRARAAAAQRFYEITTGLYDALAKSIGFDVDFVSLVDAAGRAAGSQAGVSR